MDRPNRDNYYVRDFEVGTLRAYSKAQDEYIDYLNKEPSTNKDEIKVGDWIEWTFKESWGDLSGKTFQAEVAMIDLNERDYGVHPEYTYQDLIPFDQATKIEKPIQPQETTTQTFTHTRPPSTKGTLLTKDSNGEIIAYPDKGEPYIIKPKDQPKEQTEEYDQITVCNNFGHFKCIKPDNPKEQVEEKDIEEPPKCINNWCSATVDLEFDPCCSSSCYHWKYK